MKHTTGVCCWIVLAFASGSAPLAAADPAEVPWSDLCRTAGGRQISIETAAGETVEGYCVSIDVNQINVYSKGRGSVQVARSALSKMHVYRAKGNNLKDLKRGMRRGLRYGANNALSPAAPVGIPAIPLTLAWGAFSAPFCVLGDLRHALAGKQQIKPI